MGLVGRLRGIGVGVIEEEVVIVVVVVVGVRLVGGLSCVDAVGVASGLEEDMGVDESGEGRRRRESDMVVVSILMLLNGCTLRDHVAVGRNSHLWLVNLSQERPRRPCCEVTADAGGTACGTSSHGPGSLLAD